MRDLKADLGIARGMKPLNTSEYYEGISLETAQQYMMAAEGWPHAIERALEAEKYVTELENQIDILSTTLAMYCSPYYDMQERAEKAEALARELVHHLDNTACVLASRVKLARKDLIGRTRDGGAQWASDVLGEVKQVVTKAKEVLGNE